MQVLSCGMLAYDKMFTRPANSVTCIFFISFQLHAVDFLEESLTGRWEVTQIQML